MKISFDDILKKKKNQMSRVDARGHKQEVGQGVFVKSTLEICQSR